MDHEHEQSADKESLLSKANNPHRIQRDLHLLGISFLFVFLAYSATQNLESTVNADGNLGTVSLGIIYLSLTICSVGAPYPVKWLGSKKGMLLGLSGYWIFILANLFPSWYTMVPASLFLGFTAALLWVAEGTYITCAAKNYAAETNTEEEKAIGNFNGIFWGYYASNQVIGNLLSLIILYIGRGAGTSSTSTGPLLLTFLGCMLVGTGVACFLSSQADLSQQVQTSIKETTVLNFMNSTFGILLDKKMLLLLPLLVYSGLQQAFIWGDFTEYIVTPVLGVSLIGGVMAAFGAADAMFSLLAGRLSSGISSISNLVYLGAVAQLLVLVWIYIKQSYENDWGGYLSLFGQALLWGLGDAAFNTQISALMGILFLDDTEAAFAQWKIWQSVATSLIFFINSSTTMSMRIVLLLITLPTSLLSFSGLRLIILSKAAGKNSSSSISTTS